MTGPGKACGVIAVAMSGGVDSSVVALRLQREGWQVFGVTALFANPDADAAATAAERIGIEHHVVDLREPFDRLIASRFADAFANGRTPSPCGWCNPALKFGLLMEQAISLGADAFATGHYVRREETREGNMRLLRGLDPGKDQSYFLFALTQAQLKVARFPLGHSHKRDVKKEAAALGLASRDKPESQDLCFVPDGRHVNWLEARCPDIGRPGDIVDGDGKVLGRHRGLHAYTIGQRKGLGVAMGFPAYVTRLNAEENQVVLGPREDAMQHEMMVGALNWQQPGRKRERQRLSVQIRYKHASASATCVLQDDGLLRVVFEEPQFSVTPGQIAALYDGDELLGGGLIR